MAQEHDNHIEARIKRIEESNKRIEEELRVIRQSAGATEGGVEEVLKQMAVWDDKLDAIVASVNKVGEDVKTVLAQLNAKIASGQPTDAEVAKLDAIGTALADVDADVLAAGDPIVVPAP